MKDAPIKDGRDVVQYVGTLFLTSYALTMMDGMCCNTRGATSGQMRDL
jgi:hypothetical protein